jgi:hypothetical protein
VPAHTVAHHEQAALGLTKKRILVVLSNAADIRASSGLVAHRFSLADGMSDATSMIMTHVTHVQASQDSEDPSVEAAWQGLIERIAARWPALTPNDLRSLSTDDFARGNYEGLVGRVRERYGRTETNAQREVAALVQSATRAPDAALEQPPGERPLP